MIVARTVARLIDLAMDAVAKGVATEEDIDTAMRLGVNYPLGPFAWSRRLGRSWAHSLLDDLHLRDPSGRYAPRWRSTATPTPPRSGSPPHDRPEARHVHP